MDATSRQILDAAMLLPEGQRAFIAGELIDSLDPVHDVDYESAWSEEIARRIAGLESGERKTIPWSEVRARILKGRSN
jgi:putative addiction module component (TIGR02574 family)